MPATLERERLPDELRLADHRRGRDGPRRSPTIWRAAPGQLAKGTNRRSSSAGIVGRRVRPQRRRPAPAVVDSRSTSRLMRRASRMCRQVGGQELNVNAVVSPGRLPVPRAQRGGESQRLEENVGVHNASAAWRRGMLCATRRRRSFPSSTDRIVVRRLQPRRRRRVSVAVRVGLRARRRQRMGRSHLHATPVDAVSRAPADQAAITVTAVDAARCTSAPSESINALRSMDPQTRTVRSASGARPSAIRHDMLVESRSSRSWIR